MADEGRPATYDDVITAIAKQHGVSPSLAKAVAGQESSFDPNAVGADVNGQNARGVMQLMPGTAERFGVTDPHDPIQNITGGVKYLKFLSDKFKGDDGNSDVEKILQAYNGGEGNVDKGTVSAQAKAYSTQVISRMAREAASNQQVSGAGGPGGTTDQTEAPEEPIKPKEPWTKRAVKNIVAGVNPLTPEGRVNLLATATGGAATVASGGNPAAGAAGAALGGAGATGYNQMIAHAAEIPGAAIDVIRNYFASPETRAATVQGAEEGMKQGAKEAGVEGGLQALYDVTGRLLWGTAARVGRAAIGTKVGAAAKEAAEEAVSAAQATYKGAMTAAKQKFETAVETAKNLAGEAKAATAKAGEQFKAGVVSAGEKEVAEAQAAKRTAQTTAAKSAAARDAAADLEAETLRSTAEAKHTALVSQPPSREELAGSTRNVVKGVPGLLGEGTGPAASALNMAGENIRNVAKQGPAIETQGVKDAMNTMVKETFPEGFLKAEQKAGPRAVSGFGPGAVKGTQALPAAATVAPKNMTSEQVTARQGEIAKLIAQKMNLPEAHPLPGILAKIQTGLETATGNISFEQAHMWKSALDKAVNWDRSSKSLAEQVTKGVRTALRQELSTYEPYNTANQAYKDVIGLYRGKGAGPKFINAVINDPDKIATFLKDGSPQAAAEVKRLLVDQSAKGGDPAAGQKAWEAVRANHTYQNLILGSAEGLEKRVTDFITQNPEFARTVYGDAEGQKILGNLMMIGRGIQEAGVAGTEKQAAAKAAGTAERATALEAGRAGVEKATAAAKEANRQADLLASESNRQRTVANRQDIQAAKRTAGEEVAKTVAAESPKVTAAQESAKTLKQGSMKPYLAGGRGMLADVASVVASPVHPIVGARAGARLLGQFLLHSPNGPDLIQAAAHSTDMTKKMARVFSGNAPLPFVQGVIRELGSMVEGGIRRRKESAAATEEEDQQQAVNQ